MWTHSNAQGRVSEASLVRMPTRPVQRILVMLPARVYQSCVHRAMCSHKRATHNAQEPTHLHARYLLTMRPPVLLAALATTASISTNSVCLNPPAVRRDSHCRVCLLLVFLLLYLSFHRRHTSYILRPTSRVTKQPNEQTSKHMVMPTQ